MVFSSNRKLVRYPGARYVPLFELMTSPSAPVLKSSNCPWFRMWYRSGHQACSSLLHVTVRRVVYHRMLGGL